MVITFHSNVQFKRITYRDARNWTTKALENLSGHNYSNGCPIQGHNISRSSKLNNGSSREIQTVLTFHSGVRFKRMTYRDARDWITESLENSSGHYFSHGRPIQGYDISRRSKLNNRISREIQMVITFHWDVWFRRITYLDARNWSTKALKKSKLS